MLKKMVKSARSTQSQNIEDTINSITRLRKGFFLAYRILLAVLVINMIVSGIRGRLGTEDIFIGTLVIVISTVIYAAALAFEIFLKTDLVATRLEGSPGLQTGWGTIITEGGSITFRKANPSLVTLRKDGQTTILKLEGEETKSAIERIISGLSEKKSSSDGHA